MGCCGSSEAVAPESELPAPEWGKPYKVRMGKVGIFSADYNVRLLEGPEYVKDPEAKEDPKWMLLDAVGSIFDEGYSYYMKHRPPGLVDDEGKPMSNTVGAVNIKGDWDCFSFKVTGADRDTDIGLMFDWYDGDLDWGVRHERELHAVWTYSKRALLYEDYEMEKQIGFLDITGSGTWYEYEEQVQRYDDDGKVYYEWERHTDCRSRGFKYMFEAYQCPMDITYHQERGGFFTAGKLNFEGRYSFDLDKLMFKVQSDGESNCTIETFENSNPVTAMLAAYAISCKLDPKEFESKAERKCDQYISLNMQRGTSQMIGMSPEDFKKRFSKYPAPPPPMYVQILQVYVPPPPPPMVFTTSTTTTTTTMGAGGMQQQQTTTTTTQMAQQPMMQQQPMMMQQQPMMQQPMQGQMMMQQPMQGQMMQQPMQGQMMQQPMQGQMMQQPMQGQMMMQQPMQGQMMMQQPMQGQMMMQQPMQGMVMAQPM